MSKKARLLALLSVLTLVAGTVVARATREPTILNASPVAAAATPTPGVPTADPSADPSADVTVEPSADPSGGAGEPPDAGAQPPEAPEAPPTGPSADDFVNIRQVGVNVRNPRPGRNASRGTFVSRCGRNQDGHHNSDNFIVAPGVSNGAHHVHDYVGNVSTDGFSTDESLAAAETTCQSGDKSVYFWPALRRTDQEGTDADAPGGGLDGNVGRVLTPTTVTLQFRGNPTSRVVAMPRFLRTVTGDAKATTNGPANARAQWTCSGFTNRVTTKYPLCPRGSRVTRILDFASCWDGANLDSANHRTHILFPDRSGRCAAGTRAVPQLRMTISYALPAQRVFALDSFPEQLRNPVTDHGDFANVMPDRLMTRVVNCINRGQRC
ncbi:DUF1996 domain-containing protein [Actinomadura alba]|uniref:DUF1996 domain-containing protein n=1 Tax=Actinomadura alba TaxID=406431 RepID=A0ABR7LKX7_9ACTN|nr:DUF1996 domain-containing protein [Actinomadura alba]MBC6465390.1 DUF1996 domain-containing protein [Actinomadura alba]